MYLLVIQMWGNSLTSVQTKKGKITLSVACKVQKGQVENAEVRKPKCRNGSTEVRKKSNLLVSRE